MATWGEIKLAALKKMDPSITNLTVQRSTKDYLNAIIPAANRGLQDLATVGRFIIKEYDIMTSDVKNLLGEDHRIHQHINEDIEFKCDYGKAFYFELSGPATVNIYVDDSLSRTVESAATAGFIPLKCRTTLYFIQQTTLYFTQPYLTKNCGVIKITPQYNSQGFG